MLRLRGLLLATLLTLVTLVLPSAAHAGAAPVIVAGRETEIVALVSPYFGDGKPITNGYSLSNVDVQAHAIRFVVRGPNGKQGAVRLEYPSSTPAPARTTASFGVVLEGEDGNGMTAALEALVATIRSNDKGTFWAKAPVPSEPPPQPASRYASAPKFPSLLMRIPSLMRDGVLIFIAAFAFLLTHLRQVLRREARVVAWALVAMVAAGAVIRLSISRETAMNVWPYQRVVPLARAAFEGTLLPWASRALHARIYLTDVIFKATTLLAIVTPLAFFAHARYVLRDTKGALFAAALLVILPKHIHFSRADSEFIQSLATSSLTFVVLYTALRDPSRRFRALCFALLPIFSIATYFVRPENMFFWLVDVGAILLTSGEEAPRRRKIIALVEVTAAAALAFVVHLLTQYRSALEQGLSLRTVTAAVAMFFDLRLNTLLNSAITPPGIVVLAVIGGIYLYRRGERGRALFLTGWLLGFFVVHSFVRPSEPAMQARYHMHLITPLLLLAASALPAVVQWPRRAVVAGAIYLAASPLVHLRFERDTDFNEMHEFEFLRTVSRDIPEECTVLEFSPAVGTSDAHFRLASRLDRMATQLEGGVESRAFRVVNAGVMRGAKAGDEPYETLSDEALALLRSPPPCLLVYEGLTCRSHRPASTAVAPVCEELRRKLDLHPIASTSFKSRVYDEVLAGRMITLPSGETQCLVRLRAEEEIPLTLYRAAPRPIAHAP